MPLDQLTDTQVLLLSLIALGFIYAIVTSIFRGRDTRAVATRKHRRSVRSS